jgi:spore coat polysaccharide biosynthesis protein SpsF
MILGVLQARVASTRLPGKVLLPVLGEPMIVRQIERLRRAKTLDDIVVATSADPSDDALQEVCERVGVACFRGSLDDVLDRFYHAAFPYAPHHVVRLTGDCPLLDPVIVDAVVEMHLAGDFDYTSSALKPSFPDGLDVEALRFEVLDEVWRTAVLRSEREHVTLRIYRQPGRYRLGSFSNDTDLSFMRWTVDEPEDLEMVRRVYEALYPAHPAFATGDILDLLRTHPEIAGINRGHRRNEGLEKSLREDGPAHDLAEEET